MSCKYTLTFVKQCFFNYRLSYIKFTTKINKFKIVYLIVKLNVKEGIAMKTNNFYNNV